MQRHSLADDLITLLVFAYVTSRGTIQGGRRFRAGGKALGLAVAAAGAGGRTDCDSDKRVA